VLGIFTAEEMRRLEGHAIAEMGIPGATLMENAGRGAADAIVAAFPALGAPRRGARVVIVCGKGGNGGDGFVVARWLKRLGAVPSVLLAFPPAEIGGDARLKLEALRRTGIRPLRLEDDRAVAALLARAHVVVDALLGIGSRGIPEGRLAGVIELINGSGRPVVALDIPSGMSADGGAQTGAEIRATMTLTFAGLKRGLLTAAGDRLAGRVSVVPIGVPDAEVARRATVFLLQADDVARHFPGRPREAHKGTYGHLLLVAGSLGKTGAAALSASAAMRSGGGLVTVATPVSQQPIVAGLVLEAMTEPLPETSARTIALKAREAVATLAASRDAVAIGPGLGLDAETQQVVRSLIQELPRPLAADADALTALAGHLEVLRTAPSARCLTPHPGEMARMLGTRVDDVQRDRIETVRAFATRYGASVVLKGARSVIGAPDGRVFVNPTGNPGMASGGTGDVLTGILGAFLARGMDPVAALQSSVYLHGSAGDIAAERVGQEPLIASDVIAAIPEAFKRLGGASG
jgi:NAD(P)H-hydrate epimerase